MRKVRASYSDDELRDKLRDVYTNALNGLVERRLILNAYEAQKIRIPEAAVDERVNEITHDVFKGDRSELISALGRERLTYDRWRGEIRDRLVVSAMRQASVEQNVTVDPNEVRRYYEDNLEQFRSPAQVKLSLIVLKKGAGEESAAAKRREAETVLKRLRAGEDFASLAETVSEGHNAKQGGDWGWVEPGMLRQELANAVEKLAAGTVSGIIETADELYIARSSGRKEAEAKPFEEAAPGIEKRLRREKAAPLYEAWMNRLKKTAYIRLFDADVF
jgi:parvulin-like peptidyl-prolyl isomerase